MINARRVILTGRRQLAFIYLFINLLIFFIEVISARWVILTAVQLNIYWGDAFPEPNLHLALGFPGPATVGGGGVVTYLLFVISSLHL